MNLEYNRVATFPFEDYLNAPLSSYRRDLLNFLSRLSFEIGFFEIERAISKCHKSMDLINSSDLLEYSLSHGTEAMPASSSKVSLLGGFYPVVLKAKFSDSLDENGSAVYRFTLHNKRDGKFSVVAFHLDGIVSMLNFILLEQYLEHYRQLRYFLAVFSSSVSASKFVLGLDYSEELDPKAKAVTHMLVVLENLRSGLLNDWDVSKLLGLSLTTVVRYRKGRKPFLFSVGASNRGSITEISKRVPKSLYPFFQKATKSDIFVGFLQEGFRGTKVISNNLNFTIQWVNRTRNELIFLLLRRMVFVTSREFKWCRS